MKEESKREAVLSFRLFFSLQKLDATTAFRERPNQKGETAKHHFDVMRVMTSNSVQSEQADLISARVMQSYSTLK